MAVFMTRLVQPVSASGGIELVTVHLSAYRKEGTFYYTDGEQLHSISTSPSVDVQVAKNTIMALEGALYQYTGNVQQINGKQNVFVTGECTITTY